MTDSKNTIRRNRKRFSRDQAIAEIKAGRKVELVSKDATREWWQYTPVRLDEDGELVMRHPTDPGAGYVAAPDVRHYQTVAPSATEDQVRALLRAAREAGDAERANLCTAALYGDERAWDECTQAISGAQGEG